MSFPFTAPTSLTRAPAWMVVLSASLLGVLLPLVSGSTPAAAHAQLVHTNPANGAVLHEPPHTLTFQFNESVQLVGQSMRLFSSQDTTPVSLQARTVDSTVEVALPHRLGQGSYTVAYRLVSADSHPITGALRFQVAQEGSEAASNPPAILDSAEPASTSPAALEILNWLLNFVHYVGLLLAAGLLFFERIIVGNPLRLDRPTLLMLRGALSVGILSSWMLLPLTAVRATGEGFLPVSSWWAALSGPLLTATLLITVLGGAAVLVRLRWPTLAAGTLAPLLAAAALGAPVLVGHTQTVTPLAVMWLADYVHLLVGAFWVGGVVGLLRYLLALRSTPPEDNQTQQHALGDSSAQALQVVGRFSHYALVSVITLSLSGLLMGLFIVQSWQALFGATYGRILMAKLGVLTVVLALAAWNRWRLLPQLRQLRQHPTLTSPTSALSRLRRSLAAEAGLLVIVLAVTGVLTTTSPSAHQLAAESPAPPPPTAAAPARTPPALTQQVNVSSQGLTVEGTLKGDNADGVSGPHTLTFSLTYQGTPMQEADIEVHSRLPEQALGPLAAPTQFSAQTGLYRAAVELPVSGQWHIQFLVRIDTYTQPIALISVTV